MPKDGDTFYLAIDQMPSSIQVTSPGPNQRWDFTTLLAPYSRAYLWKSEYAAGTPLLKSQTDVFTEAIYHRTGNGLFLLSARGQDPLGLSRNAQVSFSPALKIRSYPMRYRDQHTQRYTMTITSGSNDVAPAILKKLPYRPDSLRLRVAVERYVEVDAWGRMIIPGGIHNVLRERQEEHFTVQIDARVGNRKWQHITHLVPLSQLLLKQDIKNYLYYTDELPEPIANVSVNPVNQTVLRVEFKAHNVEEDFPLLISSRPNVFAYPNPVIALARFEFFNLPPGDYELSIYNLLGVPLIQKHYQINGNRTERIDVSDLRKGPYLYALKDERGNTIITKRLVVIRP